MYNLTLFRKVNNSHEGGNRRKVKSMDINYYSARAVLCTFLCYGAVRPDLAPNRALTYMEKQMYANADLDGLGSLYNSLKTEYDRRYFLLGIPGFFAERKIRQCGTCMGFHCNTYRITKQRPALRA